MKLKTFTLSGVVYENEQQCAKVAMLFTLRCPPVDYKCLACTLDGRRTLWLRAAGVAIQLELVGEESELHEWFEKFKLSTAEDRGCTLYRDILSAIS